MNRWTVSVAAAALTVLMSLGCSGGGNPVAPQTPELTGAVASTPVQTHLWGYYDVYIDIPTQTVTAVPNRNLQFAANVVQFVNGNPANLSFNIIGTPADPGGAWVDVDIDVSIRHPFPGLTQYNGYDVRGVFIANGSKTMKYDTQLKYAAHSGPDQEMYDYNKTTGDIHTGLVGNPDGYTRWFNPVEFLTPGLFGYTQGKFATPGYSATGTLNPYKYFADGLTVTGDLWNFLTTTTNNGKFSAGQTNTRNYYLRFPTPSPGVKYGYAIVASWIDEKTHPANAPEACGLKVNVTPDLYYVSASDKGGKLILDVSIPRQWGAVPSTIFIESTVLNNPYQFSSAQMVPTGGGAGYSTYHAEIVADNITGNSSTVYHEFWVIPQYDAYNYKNDFGVTNGAGDDKLAAFFRYELYVSPTSYNKPPDANLATPDAASGWQGQSLSVTFDASASTDPDPGDTLTFSWDFNNDGTYGDAKDGGTDVKPIKKFTAAPPDNKVSVKVTDSKGAFDTASCTVSLTWFKPPKGKDLKGDEYGDRVEDNCIDPTTGDALVLFCNDYNWPYTAYVRRYHMSDGYESYDTIKLDNKSWPWFDSYYLPTLIDCNYDGYWFIASKYPIYSYEYWDYGNGTSHFNPKDEWITTTWTKCAGSLYTYMGYDDVVAMGKTGTRANDHVATWGYALNWGGSGYVQNYWHADGFQDTGFSSKWDSDFYVYNPEYGKDKLNWYTVRAAEADLSGDYIWFLKSGYGYPVGYDHYVSKFSCSGTTLTWANVACGTGSPDSGDKCWEDAYDVTICEQDTIYVLDMIWMYPTIRIRLKAFDETNGASLGGFTVVDHNYDEGWYPYFLRVDGCKDRGFMVETHGNYWNWPAESFRMDVILDSEVPPT